MARREKVMMNCRSDRIEIGELLERHHLRVKWYKVFDRFIITITDDEETELATMREIDPVNAQQRILHFLKNYSPTKD